MIFSGTILCKVQRLLSGRQRFGLGNLGGFLTSAGLELHQNSLCQCRGKLPTRPRWLKIESSSTCTHKRLLFQTSFLCFPPICLTAILSIIDCERRTTSRPDIAFSLRRFRLQGSLQKATLSYLQIVLVTWNLRSGSSIR